MLAISFSVIHVQVDIKNVIPEIGVSRDYRLMECMTLIMGSFPLRQYIDLGNSDTRINVSAM